MHRMLWDITGYTYAAFRNWSKEGNSVDRIVERIMAQWLDSDMPCCLLTSRWCRIFQISHGAIFSKHIWLWIASFSCNTIILIYFIGVWYLITVWATTAWWHQAGDLLVSRPHWHQHTCVGIVWGGRRAHLWDHTQGSGFLCFIYAGHKCHGLWFTGNYSLSP